MEDDDYRSFEPVKIGLTSVETGRERFTRDDIFTPPPLAYWRCNLTALSQRFNLHFIATRDTIAVYRPEFPFQKLRRLPALLIPPALANQSAGGFIDDRVPHAINHLIVGDLGKEEVLLLATDSGNVTGYYTKTIEEAIRKDPYRFSTDARSDHIGVRPFFTYWVHESAWGLAIHTNARMIAVSANTPHRVQNDDPCAKITVFAFALTDDHDDAAADEGELPLSSALDLGGTAGGLDWEEWTAMGVDAVPPRRTRNYKITLAGVEGHDHNVPSISFVNTDEDVRGDWLLSTDIGGELKIWQIWQGIRQNSWDFAEKRIRSGFFRRREGGWLVAALDPRSFRSARSMDQFCGHSKAPQYHGHSHLESYDLTHIVRLRTPGNSHAHPLLHERTQEEIDVDDNLDISDSWSNVGDAAVDLDEDHSEQHVPSGHRRLVESWSAAIDSNGTENTESDLESGVMVQPAMPESGTSLTTDVDIYLRPQSDILVVEDLVFDDADESFESDEAELESLSASEDQEDTDGLSSMSRRSTTSLSSVARISSPDAHADILSTFDVDSPPRKRPQNDKQSRPSMSTGTDPDMVRARGMIDALKIPTLHCSASNLRLLMVPQADSPHVFCANILKQALPPAMEASNHVHIDRLNMFVEIPELGIIVIATQIGRCAICSLMKNEKTGTLGLRVDWILPTKYQELKGIRPIGPLLGIAASPVQGRLNSPSSSLSDETQVNMWGRDGIVDGVTTTFDPMVLVVEHEDEEDKQGTNAGHQCERHKTKRKRLSQDLPQLHHCQTRSEIRKWEIPSGPEPWQAMDGSRRYRLMLTYLDMTVLTYELSREVEKDDVYRETTISRLELLD